MTKALLGPDDPAPFSIINANGPSEFLLVGDHAGRAIPEWLGTMGLSDEDRKRHIAWDLGVDALGSRLARSLDAVFIAQAYSRLVVDCNRHPASPDIMALVSDGTCIAGNVDLTPEERSARITSIHTPYHQAISREIARRTEKGQPTVLIALHSFTPVMNHFVRPWDIGVLHDGGRDVFALALLEQLRQAGGMVVGANEPYHMDATDYAVPFHAFTHDLLYAELEVRQDQLATHDDIERWSKRLARLLPRTLSHCKDA
jgi:predicted N-formylglutamate amidohydrolase